MKTHSVCKQLHLLLPLIAGCFFVIYAEDEECLKDWTCGIATPCPPQTSPPTCGDLPQAQCNKTYNGCQNGQSGATYMKCKNQPSAKGCIPYPNQPNPADYTCGVDWCKSCTWNADRDKCETVDGECNQGPCAPNCREGS